MVDGKVYKKTREKMEEISYYVQVVHIIPTPSTPYRPKECFQDISTLPPFSSL